MRSEVSRCSEPGRLAPGGRAGPRAGKSEHLYGRSCATHIKLTRWGEDRAAGRRKRGAGGETPRLAPEFRIPLKPQASSLEPSPMTWRRWLQSRTRNPIFLWRMVGAILLAGIVVGVAVDAAVPQWMDVEAADDPDIEPEPSRCHRRGTGWRSSRTRASGGPCGGRSPRRSCASWHRLGVDDARGSHRGVLAGVFGAGDSAPHAKRRAALAARSSRSPLAW